MARRNEAFWSAPVDLDATPPRASSPCCVASPSLESAFASRPVSPILQPCQVVSEHISSPICPFIDTQFWYDVAQDLTFNLSHLLLSGSCEPSVCSDPDPSMSGSFGQWDDHSLASVGLDATAENKLSTSFHDLLSQDQSFTSQSSTSSPAQTDAILSLSLSSSCSEGWVSTSMWPARRSLPTIDYNFRPRFHSPRNAPLLNYIANRLTPLAQVVLSRPTTFSKIGVSASVGRKHVLSTNEQCVLGHFIKEMLRTGIISKFGGIPSYHTPFLCQNLMGNLVSSSITAT